MQQQQYILNKLPIGIVMLDREYRVTSFSSAAAEIFGAEHLRAILGKTIQAAHSGHSHSKIDWLLRQSREEDSSGYASMLINVPDRVLQLRVVQIGDGLENNGYCLILYDISDLTLRPPTSEEAAGECAAGHRLHKLPVSLQGRIALLDIDEVAFLRADGHYTEVCSAGKHYFCNLSLSQLETRLASDRFVRVHRSYIINLAHASTVCRRDEQFVITLGGGCGHEIPVSRGNVPRLRELLGV